MNQQQPIHEDDGKWMGSNGTPVAWDEDVHNILRMARNRPRRCRSSPSIPQNHHDAAAAAEEWNNEWLAFGARKY